MSNRIVHEIRHGLLVVRVRRVRASDRQGYSISARRFYRNGELWSESSRFGPDDLRYLLDEAHTWVLTQSGAKQHTTKR